MVIDRLVESLPAKVLSTDDLRDGVKFRRQEAALGQRYISLNQLYVKYISLDIDVAGAAYLWEDKNLPPPTIVAISRDTGRCHYHYELKAPVIYTESGRAGPQRFLEAVDRALTTKLGADPAYVGLLTKNPLHPAWKVLTHNTLYDLSDFLEWLELPANTTRTTERNILGRNCTLFDELRKWAYARIKSASSAESWMMDVQAKALDLNVNYSEPLPAKEVLYTAKSVANWVWKHRTSVEGYRDRRVLDLPESMPLQQRQKHGAAYSNQVRRESSQSRIARAIEGLRHSGEPVTQKGVSLRAGVSLDTVKRNWSRVVQDFRL
jgi:Replicase family/Primase C terminal 1 (PriCT-1)